MSVENPPRQGNWKPSHDEEIQRLGHCQTCDERKPLHSLSPQELADQGIPVEVALRARIENTERQLRDVCDYDVEYALDRELAAYRDALAIIEAKR